MRVTFSSIVAPTLTRTSVRFVVPKPSRLKVSSTIPGGSEERRYWPRSFVVKVRVPITRSPASSISTPGSTAPETSCTVPTTIPVVAICAAGRQG